MIEIIKEKVDIPEKPRYKKDIKNNKWCVIDTDNDNIRYKGTWENVCLACHNLNKKYYRDLNKKI